MITATKGRIRIYASVRQSLELAKKIYEKHRADGDRSLLSGIEGFSWDATGPKIIFCQEKHKEAIILSKRAEEVYRQRDAVLAEIMDITRVSKFFLEDKFGINLKDLGEWGFDINKNSGITEKIPP